MGNDNSYEEDFILWAALRQTRHETHEILKMKLEAYGVSPEQGSVLMLIAQASSDVPTVPMQLSQWLSRGRPAVSVLLNRMEQKGLIYKDHNLGKKNLVSLRLTEKGKQVYNQIKGLEVIHTVLSVLSIEQREQLSQSLEAIRAKTRELREDHQK